MMMTANRGYRRRFRDAARTNKNLDRLLRTEKKHYRDLAAARGNPNLSFIYSKGDFRRH